MKTKFIFLIASAITSCGFEARLPKAIMPDEKANTEFASSLSGAESLKLRDELECAKIPKNLDQFPLLENEQKALNIAYARSLRFFSGMTPYQDEETAKKLLLNELVPLTVSCETFKKAGFAKYEDGQELEKVWHRSASAFAAAAETFAAILAGEFNGSQDNLQKPHGLPLRFGFKSKQELKALSVLSSINQRILPKTGGRFRDKEDDLYIGTLVTAEQQDLFRKFPESFSLLTSAIWTNRSQPYAGPPDTRRQHSAWSLRLTSNWSNLYTSPRRAD